MSLLTPTQASEIVGVPAVQLCRWAYLGQGPRNSGTKHKPMFDEDDLAQWKIGQFKSLLGQVKKVDDA